MIPLWFRLFLINSSCLSNTEIVFVIVGAYSSIYFSILLRWYQNHVPWVSVHPLSLNRFSFYKYLKEQQFFSKVFEAQPAFLSRDVNYFIIRMAFIKTNNWWSSKLGGSLACWISPLMYFEPFLTSHEWLFHWF